MNRYAAVAGAVLTGSFALGACDLSPRSEGVYYELIEGQGLGEERAYALRLTVWTWGESVGGRVDFFEIDGTINTRAQPFFEVSECRYFGPSRLLGRDFRVRTEGMRETPLTMQASWDPEDRDRIRAFLFESGGALVDEGALGPGGAALRFDVAPTEIVETRCPAEVQPG